MSKEAGHQEQISLDKILDKIAGNLEAAPNSTIDAAGKELTQTLQLATEASNNGRLTDALKITAEAQTNAEGAITELSQQVQDIFARTITELIALGYSEEAIAGALTLTDVAPRESTIKNLISEKPDADTGWQPPLPQRPESVANLETTAANKFGMTSKEAAAARAVLIAPVDGREGETTRRELLTQLYPGTETEKKRVNSMNNSWTRGQGAAGGEATLRNISWLLGSDSGDLSRISFPVDDSLDPLREIENPAITRVMSIIDDMDRYQNNQGLNLEEIIQARKSRRTRLDTKFELKLKTGNVLVEEESERNLTLNRAELHVLGTAVNLSIPSDDPEDLSGEEMDWLKAWYQDTESLDDQEKTSAEILTELLERFQLSPGNEDDLEEMLDAQPDDSAKWLVAQIFDPDRRVDLQAYLEKM